VAAVAPITFEAEAEKPMRASRAKKDVVTAEDLVEAADMEETEEDTVIEELETTGDIDEAASETVASLDGAPKKKRTRRGTRGGRSRKKPVVAGDVPAGDEATSAAEVNGRTAPRIHLPPPELVASTNEEPVADEPAEATDEITAAPEVTDEALDGPPKRKRSRRGSRGGKKRRKPTAHGVDGEALVDDLPEGARADEEAPAEVVTLADTRADGEPPEYVPMSEWIDDFESRSRA
jgi:ribonuclease E